MTDILPPPKIPDDSQLRLAARDKAQDLLIRTLFVALHQIHPYYVELASKDERPIYRRVHEGNNTLAIGAMKAYEEYREEKGAEA
jgi:hypothetical protein